MSVLLSSVVACGDTTSGDGEGGGDGGNSPLQDGQELCQQFLACAEATDDMLFQSIDPIYGGAEPECFNNPEIDPLTCGEMCKVGMQLQRTGNPDVEECWECETDSDCGGTYLPGTTCSPNHECIDVEAAPKAVDILFIVDNTGSMAPPQDALAATISSLTSGLESELGVDIRVGVTTTDDDNPRCEGTSSESGALVGTSCRDRIADFEFLGNPPVDASDMCFDRCSSDAADGIDSGKMSTETENDPAPSVRPWIEWGPSGTNLPAGVSPSQALACVLPQGVAGCGFESPLESMRKALRASDDPESPNHDFLRSDATLAVVFVTDEVDCSDNPDHNDIFTSNKTFWTVNDFGTSGLCWNAGVSCSGNAPEFDSCDPEDYDSSGNAGASFDDAVLYPVSRYIETLRDIESLKQGTTAANAKVVVAVVSGVPSGYSAGEAEIPYADSSDTNYNENFGIGPGCTEGSLSAPPPVRLRALAEAFGDGDRNLFSICGQEFEPAMEYVVSELAQQF